MGKNINIKENYIPKETKDYNQFKKLETANLILYAMDGDVNENTLNKLSVEKYKNGVFLIKYNDEVVGYVESEAKLKSILENLANESKEIDVIKLHKIKKEVQAVSQTKKEVKETQKDVEGNPSVPKTEVGTNFVVAKLGTYKLETLVNMYKNAKAGGLDITNPKEQEVLDKIKNAIYAKLRDERISISKKIEIVNSIFGIEDEKEKAIFYILQGIETDSEGTELLNVLGKEKIQNVVKNAVLINNSFAEKYMYYLNAPDDVKGFSVSCGEGYKNEEVCESYVAFIFALKENYPIKSYNAVSHVISKAFEGKLDHFKNVVGKGIEAYENVKGELPSGFKTVLQKKGLAGALKYAFSKTNMSEGQKEFWTEKALPIVALGVAIWTIFKLIKENGWKGLVGLIGMEIGSEAAFGKTLFGQLGSILYGGSPLFGADAAKKGAEHKEFSTQLGYATFMLFIMGDKKLGEIQGLSFDKNGKTQFDVMKYIRSLPNTDETKALLTSFVQKHGESKVNKMFATGFMRMGVVNQQTKDRLKDKKISELYKGLVDKLKKEKEQKNAGKGQENGNVGEGNVVPDNKVKQPAVGSLGNVDSDKKAGSVGTGGTVDGGSDDDEGEKTIVATNIPKSKASDINRKNIGASHDVDFLREGQETKTYKFRNNRELSKAISENLKNKIGVELYGRLSKKLKELDNLLFFTKLLEVYAQENADKDKGKRFQWDTFFHILDGKDQFIKGADSILENKINSWTNMIKYIFEAASSGNKEKVRRLLDLLDNQTDLDSFIKDISGLHTTRINSFDEYDEIKKVKELIKNGNKVKILDFFAEEMKTPDYLRSYTLQNIKVKKLDLGKVNDDLYNNGLTPSIITSVLNKINGGTTFAGVKINPNVDYDDVKNILEKVHTNKGSKEQKIQLLNVLLGGLIMKKSENELLSNSKLSSTVRELVKDFYENDKWYTDLVNHAGSSAYKLVMIGAISVGTDLALTSALGSLFEGGILGAGAGLVIRGSAFHLSAGMSSLWMNEELTKENAWEVATDINGYIHDIVYMVALESFSFITKVAGETKIIKSFSGELDKSMLGKFAKGLGKYGINVSGLLAIDHFVFDGEFTPEEVANVLLFAAVMGLAGSKITAKKGPNGEIKVLEIKRSKLEKGLTHAENRYSALESEYNNRVSKIRSALEKTINKKSTKETELTDTRAKLQELQSIAGKTKHVINQMKIGLKNLLRKLKNEPKVDNPNYQRTITELTNKITKLEKDLARIEKIEHRLEQLNRGHTLGDKELQKISKKMLRILRVKTKIQDKIDNINTELERLAPTPELTPDEAKGKLLKSVENLPDKKTIEIPFKDGTKMEVIKNGKKDYEYIIIDSSGKEHPSGTGKTIKDVETELENQIQTHNKEIDVDKIKTKISDENWDKQKDILDKQWDKKFTKSLDRGNYKYTEEEFVAKNGDIYVIAKDNSGNYFAVPKEGTTYNIDNKIELRKFLEDNNLEIKGSKIVYSLEIGKKAREKLKSVKEVKIPESVKKTLRFLLGDIEKSIEDIWQTYGKKKIGSGTGKVIKTLLTGNSEAKLWLKENKPKSSGIKSRGEYLINMGKLNESLMGNLVKLPIYIALFEYACEHAGCSKSTDYKNFKELLIEKFGAEWDMMWGIASGVKNMLVSEYAWDDSRNWTQFIDNFEKLGGKDILIFNYLGAARGAIVEYILNEYENYANSGSTSINHSGSSDPGRL